MKKTMVVMMMVFVLLAFTAPAMAEECDTDIVQSKKDKGKEYYDHNDFDTY